MPPSYDLLAYSKRLSLPVVDTFGALSLLRGLGTALLSSVWVQASASSSIIYSSPSSLTFSTFTLLQGMAWSAVMLYLFNRGQLKLALSSSAKTTSLLRPFLTELDGELAHSQLLTQLLAFVTISSALQVVVGLSCYRV